MCTVSWATTPDPEEDGYVFLFNRDESRERMAGTPPEFVEIDGVRSLMPIDPVGGGSWIFTNQFGLTGCVLNHYAADMRDVAKPQSRGQLVRSLSSSSNVSVFSNRAKALVEASVFRPFILIAIPLCGEGVRIVWNGERVTVAAPNPPVTTSSYRTEQVLESRHRRFPAELSAQNLAEYHRDSEIVASAESVRMSRPDSKTVSLTEVAVDRLRARMSYAPRDGEDGFLDPVFLELPLNDG